MKYITSSFVVTMIAPAIRARGVDIEVTTITEAEAMAWASSIPAGPEWVAAQAVHVEDAAGVYSQRLGRFVPMRRQSLRLVPGDDILVGLPADGAPWSHTMSIEWTRVRVHWQTKS